MQVNTDIDAVDEDLAFAMEAHTLAQDAFVEHAQGGMREEGHSAAGEELLRVFAATCERFTAALAPYKSDPAAAKWLDGRPYAFGHGWEKRLDPSTDRRTRHLVHAWQDAGEALYDLCEPDRADDLRAVLTRLEHELAAYRVQEAREAGHQDLAHWLDLRSAGQMY
ncbi:hypothetical protein [Streptomyces sp. NPDC088925]|uniref:hypothetical protein n=1 Tax=Streptomyces sp. NPDC088925 TaxID=3365914 RepID=UPI00381F6E68